MLKTKQYFEKYLIKKVIDINLSDLFLNIVFKYYHILGHLFHFYELYENELIHLFDLTPLAK